jgi:hypothetical protein
MMLAVPVFYDTPENAAALASYMEQKGHLVERYELGEEPDGQRVAPDDFGALYSQAARAIRKAAPCGILGGPSFVTVDVDPKDDTYRFDHRWWIRGFRRELARQGEEGNYQFLSFEWYPFDDVEGREDEQVPLAAGMLDRAIARLRPLGLPLVIGEGNYSVFSCRQEVDLGGALLNAEMAAQFLANGGATMYYYSYEPNKLEESSGSWGNQMMLLQGREGERSIPLASFHALRLLTQGWMNPEGGLHEAFAVKTDLPKEHQKFLSVFALRRPDKSWSLLVINKDATHAVRLSGIASQEKKSEKLDASDALFRSPRRLMTYSAGEYEWHADGKDGFPRRNLLPKSRVIEGDEPIIIPPWSIAVLRAGAD